MEPGIQNGRGQPDAAARYKAYTYSTQANALERDGNHHMAVVMHDHALRFAGGPEALARIEEECAADGGHGLNVAVSHEKLHRRVTSGAHQRSTIQSAKKLKAKFRGDGRKLAKLDAIIAKHARSLPLSERKLLVPRPRPVAVRAITIRSHRSPGVSSVSASASDSSGGDDGPPSADSDPPSKRVHRANPSENPLELAPWRRIAHECRWRALRYLGRELRPPVRAFLLEHVRRLEAVLRSGRAA